MKFLMVLLIAACASAKSLNASRADGWRLVIGGSMDFDGIIPLEFAGHLPIVVITAAGINPTADYTTISNGFIRAGVPADQIEWCPIFGTNCAARTSDPVYVGQIEQAGSVFMSGGQSGRLQTCLFGGAESGSTPLLEALHQVPFVGGSSAGAMNQPHVDLLITGQSSESYTAVRNGAVFFRPHGNALISRGLVDSHFSERGRQGRFLVLAAQPDVGRSRFAFGVDEDSALKVHDDDSCEVIGTAGVVVYESVPAGWPVTEATMHFLTRGDVINADNTITFAPWKVPSPHSTMPSPSNSVFSSTNFRDISIALAGFSSETSLTNYHGNPAVEVIMSNTGTSHVSGVEGAHRYHSFTNMKISMRSSSSFDNPESANLNEKMWMTDE